VGQFTVEALHDVVSGYEASKDAALVRRDALLREFHARGWRPVDLQRVTGYSRETIRQALHPDVRQAANTSRRKVASVPSASVPSASVPSASVPAPSLPATSLPATSLPGAARSSRPADRYAGYGDRKPYVVAEDLDDLRGPTAGTVTLPAHLDWSGNASYDLDKPARFASMYRTVLNEAGSTEDLRAWLDGRRLRQLWSTLWLPPQLRRQWESRFPALTSLRVELA
jgi:hypothetical protein